MIELHVGSLFVGFMLGVVISFGAVMFAMWKTEYDDEVGEFGRGWDCGYKYGKIDRAISPKTNADRIRAMTDEELADEYIRIYNMLPRYTDSWAWLREWLKSPVEVDNG